MSRQDASTPGFPPKRSPAVPLLALAALAGAPAAMAAGLPAFATLTDRCLHLLRFCFATLVRFDALLHGLPVLLLGAGIAYAVVRRVRLVYRGRVIVRLLPARRPRPGERLHDHAEAHAALGCTRILLGAAPNPAFTAGLLRPRIYIAEELQRELRDEELEAVFLHELHHCRRRDPLRGALAAALADVFFWIPVLRDAVRGMLVRMEFAADDAARGLGDLVVAGAILRVADRSRTRTRIMAVPQFAAPELLERRIERLLGTPAADRLPPPPGRALALSAISLLGIWLVGVASSGSHAAHLPAAADYCPHHHEHGVLHASGPLVGIAVTPRPL